MKVIIAGGRDIEDYDLVKQAIEASGFEITTVISGNARGVDRLGERWAKENNIPCEVYPAEWDKYGKAAGPIRNKQMADVADALIAIKKPGSRGTQNMVETMFNMGKQLYVINLDDSPLNDPSLYAKGLYDE